MQVGTCAVAAAAVSAGSAVTGQAVCSGRTVKSFNGVQKMALKR